MESGTIQGKHWASGAVSPQVGHLLMKCRVCLYYDKPLSRHLNYGLLSHYSLSSYYFLSFCNFYPSPFNLSTDFIPGSYNFHLLD